MSTRLNWVRTFKELEKSRLKTIVERIEQERISEIPGQKNEGSERKNASETGD